MRFRGKSIRRKIVALLLVPLLSLTGLWGFATLITGREANQLLDVGYVVDKVGHPLEDAVRVIQKERRQTLVYLADPRSADALPTLLRERAATDRAIARIRANAKDPGVVEALRPPAAGRLNSLLEALDGLASLRRSVENRAVGRIQALDFYNHLVDPCYGFLLTLHGLENVEMDKQARALVGLIRAREMLAREDALVVSSLISKRITAEEVRTVSDLIAHRELFYDVNLELLPVTEREIYRTYWHSPDTEPLRDAEDQLLGTGPTDEPRTIDAARWQDVVNPVLDHLATENTEASDRYQDRVQPAAYSVLLKAGIAGVLGFLALLVSVVVSVRVGRDLVRDLRRLRKEAQEVSGVRLPSVMRRLAAGEHVDVETEVPHLEYEKDEVGQVGQALNTLQRAAVEAAVKQADMRRGVSEVFVNLARRNQVLLHRQLTLLDTMERRTEDTEELADLFRLDHLTTRMRRHAEGLVILSGAAPSRQWRKPVQLMDVVRAAVAEVEDYERIEVRRLPRIGVGGPAVADLTHLIAELLENATVFSPPHTAVQVLGEPVANGFTLEIHDRGLGMTPEAMLDANLRLAETPEFELSDTDRLGLFVVSRLAQRQNVRVSLQPSPYGGTTAVVFIPAALLTEAPETQGAGFRLDRKGGDVPPRRAALSQVPSGRSTSGPSSLLDGPVELEAPVGALGLGERLGDRLGDRLNDRLGDRLSDRLGEGLGDGLGDRLGGGLGGPLGDLGDIEDTETERGGLFRATRRPLRPVPGGHEQHQQASDQDPERSGRPVPLPRRKTPKLIADRGRRLDERGRAHPAPETPHGEDPRTPGAAPAEPTPTDPAPDEATLLLRGLPRRVRQASLAPQLKSAATAGPAPKGAERRDAAESDDAERDAEEVRSRMAAMQRGWQRGRRQNAEGAPSAGRGETAPGTTPEGDGR
ncbi:nitrate- and nitrite sensing domain-containing protein [Streptomyces ficellus]|uniref:histidine kinase n=1 Tax=Streptomyces ficellus TaxID=1977088 RepID=A0ABT7Z8F5_9ACTN|nr:nitrate- and nitrite sensing domain-containing protein [Streptomyces ficellus]MDN3295735.1 nitrate- and nitrite sensing domain-containing protein [Streptomyces ficellus]